MKFPSLICLGQLLMPPHHTQAEVGSRAKAVIGVVMSAVLQEETIRSVCARVWAARALNYPYLRPQETP